jgi:hypothetical protein
MSYTWSTQKSFDENKILDFLPPKMRTDIAMRVHFSTLGKVKLFRNCEPGLTKEIFLQGEGNGTACAVVKNLWALEC